MKSQCVSFPFNKSSKFGWCVSRNGDDADSIFAVNANSKKIQFPAKFNYGWYKPFVSIYENHARVQQHNDMVIYGLI